MKKKINYFFFLFSTFAVKAFAETKSYCFNNTNEITKNNTLKIERISVRVDNNRKWTENSLRILIGNFRWIPNKFKKRFDANVIVKFENGLTCNLRARIRNNGNQKDHIALKGNSIIQSIDVHLKSGHINGIRKFKLLRPNTRGNYVDEILLTELLREFDYLAPRTSLINSEINEVKSKMLFQEKPTKELLEFNQRSEGPIFEGDERFMFKLAEAIPDNQLSNLAIGMMPILEKGVNAMLARQINSEWIIKNKKNYEISHNSLSNLNLIYLLYSNKYKDSKNQFNYSSYVLDNNLLGSNISENILKLDIYNLLVFSVNGHHGLAPNNRKFYWNSHKSFFEPINSDTNANIKLKTDILPLPFGNELMNAFIELNQLLNNIEITELNQKMRFRGLKLTNNQLKEKINKIEENLSNLKNIYMATDQEIIVYNNNNIIDDKMIKKYYSSVYLINPNIYLVKQTSQNYIFKRCNIKPFKCIDYKFNDNQLLDLIEGRLIIENREYQYLGNKFSTNF